MPPGSTGFCFRFSALGSAKVGLPFIKGDVVAFLSLSRVTPRPDEVQSICNCRGAYVHQVPL